MDAEEPSQRGNVISTHNRPRRAALCLLAFWLAASLACNLPVSVSKPDPQRSARQTLAAYLLVTRTPIQGAAGLATPITPVVGQDPATPAVQYTPYHELPSSMPAQAATLQGGEFRYVTQPGDTLEALSGRFGVPVEKIVDPAQFPSQRLLPVGLALPIPNVLGAGPFFGDVMPDSEIVYSPAAADFSVDSFIQSAGGLLSTYSELVDNRQASGAQIVQRVANETSINPRILLAFLEYRSHWVFGGPAAGSDLAHPIGFYADQYSGLYKELTLVARQLTIGYYGWRTGKVVSLVFANPPAQRISPVVNAGTAAVQYLFSMLYQRAEWQAELYQPGRFLAFYQQKFGDPWQRAAAMGPVLPDGLSQPVLELPFPAGQSWVFTGGPHSAWGVGSIAGGLDFAPADVEPGCGVSRFWTTAAAAGKVVRSQDGQVVIDLDGDGREQTGWALLYLHVAEAERIPAGAQVKANDRIGHPSCEGGVSTGIHVHIARKYNGEWIGADGPVPFVLSGWQATGGDRPYTGALTKDGKVVNARPDGSSNTLISR